MAPVEVVNVEVLELLGQVVDLERLTTSVMQFVHCMEFLQLCTQAPVAAAVRDTLNKSRAQHTPWIRLHVRIQLKACCNMLQWTIL